MKNTQLVLIRINSFLTREDNCTTFNSTELKKNVHTQCINCKCLTYLYVGSLQKSVLHVFIPTNYLLMEKVLIAFECFWYFAMLFEGIKNRLQRVSCLKL